MLAAFLSPWGAKVGALGGLALATQAQSASLEEVDRHSWSNCARGGWLVAEALLFWYWHHHHPEPQAGKRVDYFPRIMFVEVAHLEAGVGAALPWLPLHSPSCPRTQL